MQIGRMFRHLQRFDWLLMLGVVVLFILGIAAIYSVELSRADADFLLVKKQLVAFVLGIICLIVVAKWNFLFLRNWGKAFYLIGIFFLVSVLIFGTELNGTKGWFILAGVSFQPVEFVKLALLVQFARYFGEHARRRFGWKEIFGSGFLLAVPFLLVMVQPDMGSAAILLGTWAILLFFSGLRCVHAAVLSGVAVIAGIFGWLFVFADYQKDRLLVFLDPALDPLVSGYNITQAKIAIGSGGLFGQGLG